MKIKKNTTKENKKKREQGLRHLHAYALGALGLILLITAAFLGPKAAFAMQDNIMCREVVSMSREEIDITSFNTGYEMNLSKRLSRFSEGLAAGEQYYVTVQDMELAPEITEWMASENGYGSSSFQMLVWNLGLVPQEAFSYDLMSWKRCVIYGDDFAGGVNFILWYIKLGDKTGGPDVRLLVDGETGDIYGVRTDFSKLIQESEQGINFFDYLNLMEYWEGYNSLSLWELCIVLSGQYGGLDVTERLKWLDSRGYGYYIDENRIYTEEIPYNNAEMTAYQREEAYQMAEMSDFLQELSWEADADGKRLDFHFPYDEGSLILRIQLDGKIRISKRWGLPFMDMTFGFPEIYERISAFLED